MNKVFFLLLFALTTLSSASPQVNHAVVVFKIGDQEAKQPYKDGELVEVIDYNEQIEGYILSLDMFRIFYCKKIPIERLNFYRSKTRQYDEHTDKPPKAQCFLRPERLTKEERENLRNPNAIKDYSTLIEDYIDCDNLDQLETLDESTVDFGDDLEYNPPAEDHNAWVGGAVTVGSGGIYATWTALGADAGTFTSHGTATQISALTYSTNSGFTNTYGIYNMILDGGNYLLTATNRAVHGIVWNAEGSSAGNEMRNFNMNRTTNETSGISNIYLWGVDNISTINIHHNIINGTHNDTRYTNGIRCSDNTPIVNIYSNVIYGCNKGMELTQINNSSKVENNTIYDCATYGIGAGNFAISMSNNASFDAGTDYANTGSLLVFSKCASSDATGSEVGLQSLVAATVFQSVTSTDSIFLWPVQGDALDSAGVNPTITGHDTYYNNVSIVEDDVNIGANGIPDGNGGSDANLHERKYLGWMGSWMSWSRRKLKTN